MRVGFLHWPQKFSKQYDRECVHVLVRVAAEQRNPDGSEK